MRILHVVRQFAPAVGGLESYVRSMALRQKQMGHDCEILTLNRVFHATSGPLPAFETIDGLSIRRVPFVGMRRFFLPLVKPSYFTQFYVIHVHNTDVFFDYIALLRPFLKAPVFATTHGGFFHTKNFSLLKKLYFNTITRFSAAQYNTVFAISGNDMNTFKSLNPNTVFQPNAVESLGGFVSTGKDFVYLGRLARHKGVDKLIDCHAVLKHQHGLPGNLHIIGPEWDVTLAELKVRAAANNVTDSVIFHGCLSPAEMPDVLRQCGYFVSASLYEGFGMSMLEAMSVGLIPFVQPNQAFQELIAAANIGACVDFGNAETAAASIVTGLTTDSAETRQKAQAFAALYSWDKLATATIAAYDTALTILRKS